MRIGWKRTLSALLVIAMMAGMLMIPAAGADGDLTGAKGDTWDFIVADGYSSTFASGLKEYKGLKFSTTTTKNGNQHGAQLGEGDTITIPVTETSCNIMVEASYSWNISIDSSEAQKSSANNSPATKLTFLIDSVSNGSVVLKAEGTTYIRRISIQEYGEPDPELELGSTGIQLKANDEAVWVKAKVVNDGGKAITWDATASPDNLVDVSAASNDGTVTVTPKNAGTGDVTVTVKAELEDVQDPLTGTFTVKVEEAGTRTKWDFSAKNYWADSERVNIEKKTGELRGLQIDATNGKFNGTGLGGWVQFNNGTIIEVPVTVPDGQKAKVTVNCYDEKNAITVDGVPNTAKVQEFTCAGTDNKVTITATANTYLGSIEVAYAAGELPPMLEVDKTSVKLKMEDTESDEITVTRSNTDAAVKAVSKDEQVVTASVAGDKVTLTAVGEGSTTVDISLENVEETELTKKTVKVEVERAGEVTYYIAEGTYVFNGNAGSHNTDEKVAAIKGLDVHGLVMQDNTGSNNHGITEAGNGAGTAGEEVTGMGQFTVNIPEGRTADLIFIACTYGAGVDLALTSDSGTVTKKEVDVDGAKGPQFTVAGASGKTTVTFQAPAEKKAFWIHSMQVIFGAQKEDARMIDVWDLTGQTVSGDDYRNNITPAVWASSGQLAGNSNGEFKEAGAFEVGDFVLTHNANDRFMSEVQAALDVGAVNQNYGKWTFEGDSYVPKGGIYCNGTGSASNRNLLVKNVFPGDKLVVYAGAAQNSETVFNIVGQGAAASDSKVYDAVAVGSGKKMEFVAKAEGAYLIYGAGGKPMYQRVVRYPGVPVKGTVTVPTEGYTGPANYGIKFVNNTTKEVTQVQVTNHKFEVTLAAGYSYNAIMTGALGWGFTTATKTVTTADNGGVGATPGMNATLEVAAVTTYTYSGNITGFAEGFDLSKVTVTLVPEENSDADEVELDITPATGAFTASLQPDVEYTLVLEGANDYYIVTPEKVNNSGDTTENITVKTKPAYTAKGKFISDLAHTASTVAPTGITFKNLEDDYTYTAAIADGGYSVDLRDGEYEATVTGLASGYSVIHHVVIDGKGVEKDMLVYAEPSGSVAKVSDVYVGYPAKANNYATITEAISAISRMGIDSEEDRVTVHIAPGTYREQITIQTPYITFINDEPDKGDALVTWYYGIGYMYYSSERTSISSGTGGYYSVQKAYDKYEKKIADRWGTTVRVLAKGFRAENIVFENSFNRYLTEEELVDGVEVSGTESIRVVRDYDADVQNGASVERAAAMVVEADECEFYNCEFYSSQDTLYTAGKIYFKNCLIEGQTDFIFGDTDGKKTTSSNCIFDGCELRWKGYTTSSKAGYLTALRVTAYLFRNCTITANPDSKLTVTPGYFGRPWGADANVKFVNTKLQSANLIADAGWYEMSGNKPENAKFGEYNTTSLDGKTVDTDKRVANTVMDKAAADALKMSDYYGDWIPYYYVAEDETVAFEVDPFVTDNGDLNAPLPGHTLTVSYSLGKANDANDVSKIEWFRVADGKETLVKASTANVDKTYQIQKADIGAQIKVTVTPTTVSGNTGAAKSITVVEPVREGFEDPDGKLDPDLGNGVNIFLAGDSTVKDYAGSGNEGSWGEFLKYFLNSDLVTVANYANGGRSSRSFINEGSLDKIKDNIGEGDFLLIQFGHNDCAYQDQYKFERYVPLGTPVNGVYPTTAGVKSATPADKVKDYGDTFYAWDCGGTYKWYLQQYIDVAKAAGATPILVTPVARMYYNSNGTIKPHHDDNTSSNNAYCTAVKQLAEENGIACIDGFELTKAMYEAAYKAAGSDKYGNQVMARKDGTTVDSTHNNKVGGIIEAAIIADAIQNMGLTISKQVKAPAQVQSKTTKGEIAFTINGEGQLTAYDIATGYTETAPYWMGYGQDLFDAIAAKAKELNPETPDNPDNPDNPDDPEVTYADLTKAIADAEAAAKTATASADGTDVSTSKKWVPTEIMEALNKAIADAKAVAEDADEATLKAAIADLAKAVENFEAAKADGTYTAPASSGGTTSRKPSTTTPDDSKTDDTQSSLIEGAPETTASKTTDAEGDVTITVTDESGEVLAEVTVPAAAPALDYKFEDVEAGSWYEAAVNAMAAMGVVKGTSDTAHTFDPNSNITRGAMAQILYNLSNGKEGLNAAFTDVAEGAWYTDAVAWAATAGVVNGYADNTFGPDNDITREQLAVMLYRYANLLGLNVKAEATLHTFADGDAVDSWAAEAMNWATANGLMKGKGANNLDPLASASRAETAVVLQRFLDLVK